MIKFINIIKKFFFLLPTKLHKKILILSFCIFINSILEFLSIGSIIPVMQSFFNSSDANNLLFKFVPQNTSSDRLVAYSLILFVSIFFFRSLFSIFLNFLKFNFIVDFRMKIAEKLVNYYLTLPYSSIHKSGSSFFLRNIENETELVCANLTDSIVQLFNNVLIIISIFLLIYFIQPRALVACLVLASVLSVIYITFYKKKISFYGKQRQEIQKNKINLIQNIFKSFKEIKIFTSENYFIKNYLRELQNYLNADKNYYIIQLNTRPFLEFASILIIIIYLFMSYKINEGNKNIFLEMAILGASAFRILPSINTVIFHIFSIKFYTPSLDILNFEISKYKKNNLKEEKNIITFEKKIEIQNLNFFYNDESKILKNINLTINKGDILGITGPSGSGKTTLIDVICGFLDNNSGTIKIDEHKLINSASLLNLGYVSQNVVLLDDTIAKNVAFGIEEKDINYSAVVESLKKASVYDFVKSLENKERSLLSEMGLNISGGQRQRISLARAFYRNSNLVVLDEPSSALDNDTVKSIINSIVNLKKTIILISHDRSLLSCCNKIVLLKNGELISIKKN